MRLRAALLGFGLLVLAACGGPAEPVWAPQSAVDAARFVTGNQPKITIFTVTSTRNGSGGHAGLLIDAPSERGLFDPAGTFQVPFVPERNDVHYGMTDRAVSVYIDYHARETFDVQIQEIPLTAAQAERVKAIAESYGAVPKAQCTLSITRILRQAGIGDFPVTYFPNSLMKAVDKVPGVTRRTISDDDADDNHGVLFQATQKS